MDLGAASPCALDHDFGDWSCSPSVDSPTLVPQDRVPESAGGACGDACGEKAADASESQVLSPKMDPPLTSKAPAMLRPTTKATAMIRSWINGNDVDVNNDVAAINH